MAGTATRLRSGRWQLKAGGQGFGGRLIGCNGGRLPGEKTLAADWTIGTLGRTLARTADDFDPGELVG